MISAGWKVLQSLLFITTLASCQTTVSNRQQLRNWPGYANLPSCQQQCISGADTLDIATDGTSIARLSDCRTKECFCGEGESRDYIYSQLPICFAKLRAACQTVGTFNGAVTFIGDYCGFQPVLKVGKVVNHFTAQNLRLMCATRLSQVH